MEVREIVHTTTPQPTMEGAGVHLHRVFGFGQERQMDPFLLLDDFHSDNPDDYISGFPWHPHRGMETVTIILSGEVEHQDSLGNKGAISGGDVQWMTAGSGIIHQEMPTRHDGFMQGFQLWINLPEAEKMMPPRYQEIRSVDIPEVAIGGGQARVICGSLGAIEGPVEGLRALPFLYDVELAPFDRFSQPVPADHMVFAYLFNGSSTFGKETGPKVMARRLVVLGSGDLVEAEAGPEGARFLLAGGSPLAEPIAWHGPVVMNTRDELIKAFEDYEAGTFLHNRS